MISDVGSGVTEFKVGDRVAYTMILGTLRPSTRSRRPHASCATGQPRSAHRCRRDASGAHRALPNAQHLSVEGGRDRARSCGGWRNRHGAHPGRAAAHRRARIATAGSDAKVELARQAGAHDVINTRRTTSSRK